jgi:hypothetical protein
VRQSRWAAVVLGVLAAACTGGFTSGSIPDSVDRTLAALPQVVTFAAETGSYRTHLDVRATGAVDAAGGRYRLTVRFPKLPPPGDPGAQSIELPRRYDVVVDAGTAYVKARGLGSPLHADTPWLKVAVAAAAPASAQLAVDRWAPYDPVALVQALRGITGDLREIGTESIDGAKVTRRRGTLDVAAALRAAPPEALAQVGAALDGLRARFGAASFPVDLWVDDDGLIHRVRFALGLRNAAGGPSPGTVTFTVDLSKATEPTSVTVPPADRVDDVTRASG